MLVQVEEPESWRVGTLLEGGRDEKLAEYIGDRFSGDAGICGIFDRNRSECRRLPEKQRGTVLQKKGFSGGTDLCQRCLHEYDGREKAVSVFE